MARSAPAVIKSATRLSNNTSPTRTVRKTTCTKLSFTSNWSPVSAAKLAIFRSPHTCSVSFFLLWSFPGSLTLFPSLPVPPPPLAVSLLCWLHLCPISSWRGEAMEQGVKKKEGTCGGERLVLFWDFEFTHGANFQTFWSSRTAPDVTKHQNNLSP